MFVMKCDDFAFFLVFFLIYVLFEVERVWRGRLDEKETMVCVYVTRRVVCVSRLFE